MKPKRIQPAVQKTLDLTTAVVLGSIMTVGAATHEVAVTVQNPDPVTRLILPQHGPIPFYSAQQFQRYPDDDGWVCQANYADDSSEIAGWTCSTEPIPWNLRANCRDWTALSIVQGSLPIGPNTAKLSFGDDGRVEAGLDLTGSDFTVTILLVGERVGNLGCSLWHPFEQTIVYAVDVHLGGKSANVSARLGVTSDGQLTVESIDSVDLEVAPNSVKIEVLSNNQIDLALAGSLVALTPLGGVVPLATAGAYSLVRTFDLGGLDLVLDLAAAAHGAVWGGCGTTEECFVEIAEGALRKNQGAIVDAINGSLKEPLTLSRAFASSFSTLGIQNSIGVDLEATIAGLATSDSENSLSTFWDVTPGGTQVGTCAAGIGGFTAPPVGAAPSVRGDLAFSFPSSLVGDVGAIALSQLDLCEAEVDFGAFAGRFSAAGNLSVARSGPREVRLTLPMRFDATGPGSGRFGFDSVLEAKPQLGHAGEILLVLKDAYITNLTGQIDVRLSRRIQVQYTFDSTACVATNGGPCIPAPNLGPTIQSNVNAAIAPRFPIPLVYRSTLYVAPHVYLQENEIAVGDAAFSVGIDLEDGSTPIDLAIPRLEAAAPYSDMTVGTATVRTIPLSIIVKNRDKWYVSPPADVLVQVGLQTETRWVPPLQPGEEYPLPLTVSAILDAAGNVTSAPQVIAHLDPNGGTGERLSANATPTIVDPDRTNNRLAQTIGTSWFRPDYTVDIVEIDGLLQSVEHGTTVISHEIVGGTFTVTARVRNIGGGHAASTSLRSLTLAVNGITYATRFAGALASSESRDYVFEITVPDGPNHYPCTYDVRARLGAGDSKPGNDSHTVSVAVSSSSCLDGGANDADLRTVDAIAEDYLDARFESMGAIQWGTDNRGQAGSSLDSGGSGAPIFDQVDP